MRYWRRFGAAAAPQCASLEPVCACAGGALNSGIDETTVTYSPSLATCAMVALRARRYEDMAGTAALMRACRMLMLHSHRLRLPSRASVESRAALLTYAAAAKAVEAVVAVVVNYYLFFEVEVVMIEGQEICSSTRK